MSELGSVTPTSFVRGEMLPAREAPVHRPGVLGLARRRLFNSPGNILLTIIGAVLLYLTIVPTIRFLFVDAVWQGSNRTACLAETAGHPVGACWPFIQAKAMQFIYGFYPEPERWRVNLTFALAALLLAPLLIPRAPAKGLNATLFFVAFPIVAYFLLHGGGIGGFGVSWTVEALANVASSIAGAGLRLVSSGSIAGHLIGTALMWIATALVWAMEPLGLLYHWIQTSSQPVWIDLGLTALIAVALVFALSGLRNGARAVLTTLAIFVGIVVVVAALRLDRGGLPIVDTRQWGGLLVTLVVSVTGIVASMPIGIALALGRRSDYPLIRMFSIGFIEFWRGVPLITVMFFATYMLPLFLPGNFTIDNLLRVLIGTALFAGAYNAEVIRGGLAAIPRGQAEAASALGLSYWKINGLVILPQALRHVIPGLVNSFIALFKDTSLVSIVALFDLLGSLRAAFADPNWSTPTTLFTGFAFTGLIYFVFCFGMSRYSLFVEHRLNAHKRS
ncbi:amino acid ABC transporter permease [Rhodopseudomonas sp. B29]|uniref:amino acid ABC transporter permease n=1 Tax=Rhodopseudomonas sp. B29 TaxID=95607 RepID=UPI0003B329AA|nr:amino acid ABC transporter permease [Rhodopseudomonas sp. B29]